MNTVNMIGAILLALCGITILGLILYVEYQYIKERNWFLASLGLFLLLLIMGVTLIAI